MSRKYQKNKKVKIVIKVFFIFFFSSLIILISMFLYNKISSLSIFKIKTILVNKSQVIDKEEIILLSKIRLGENIFKVSSINAIKNILNNPWIEAVNINKVFPDKIAITYKTKSICGIAKEDNKLYFLDCKANIIDKYNTSLKKDLIIINSKNYKIALQIIDRISKINDKLINTTNISELFVDNLNYFTIKLTNRPETIFLNYSNLDKKLSELNKVIIDIDRRKEAVSYIDASLNNNKIVIKKY